MDRKAIRSALEEAVGAALVGPRQSAEVLQSRPSDIYLTGILWPGSREMDAADDDSGSTTVASNDADAQDSGIPGYRTIRPCSFGLTFETERSARLRIELGTTARYTPSRPQPQSGTTPNATAPPTPSAAQADDPVWTRCGLPYFLEVSPTESRRNWRTSDFSTPDGPVRDEDLQVDVLRRVHDDHIVWTLTLINSAPEGESGQRDAAMLFQTQIRAFALDPDGRGTIRPRASPHFADDEDGQVNLLLYRDEREYAVGHGVSAQWPAPARERVDVVSTSWMPRAVVAAVSAAGHPALREFASRTPTPFAAATLADAAARTATCDALDDFCNVYAGWIAALAVRAPQFAGAMKSAADGNLGRCEHTLGRMREGVRMLRHDEPAWSAFTLANQAMDDQSRFPARGDRAGPLVWRPFQLAFMLLVLPGLVRPDQNAASRETLDLLWFPTGGGKTEAYLALAAFEIFLRRLTDPARRSGGGTDVLMRYTLRLLTVQQFQRAAALIAACELIRRREPGVLGTAPVSLGLYVGGEATPNSVEMAQEALRDEMAGRRPSSTPVQLLACPMCGSALTSAAYRIDGDSGTMDITCRAANCPGRNVPVPILTVDEVMYAHPPSLVIATVDKFAQLPRNGNISSLLGGRTRRPPGLIIQDELHLISGPLGSMAGLYEAALDELCSREDIRPKIIGSTATIGRAVQQVRALFDRDVLQFPPPGFEASDSFFAVRDTAADNRVYCGVASAGRSPKFALQALVAALMQTVGELRQRGGPAGTPPAAMDALIDPYWTLVAYFNSLRELGGASVLMLDDVRRQMNVLATLSGQPKSRTMDSPPVELSGRVPSRDIPGVLQDLSRSLGSATPTDPDPPDSVLASSMISVGVDVPRLGLMVVAGQPKSTAEYIQATSRVGRGLPGLVFTLYNFGRPRDLSHFEHFTVYHAALYRNVEATSVTPWASRARDKALHAVLAACVRHTLPGMIEDAQAGHLRAADPALQQLIDRLVKRATASAGPAVGALVRRELETVAADWERHAAAAPAAFRYWEYRSRGVGRQTGLLRSAEEPPSPGSTALPAPNSLRDVEPSTVFVLRQR
jgi:hypothetical protein